MTPTRAIQTYIDHKKASEEVPSQVFSVLKQYRKFQESELKWILNVSAYFPEILDLEPKMEETIHSCLQKFQDRIVPHKF